MANRSTFVAPNYTVDSFEELYNLPPSKLKDAERLQYLMKKENKSSSENIEMNNLMTSLKSYFISTERWNKFQDALVNMQLFMKNNVEDYVYTKQQEMKSYVDLKKSEVDGHVNTKTNEITKLVSDKTTEINNHVNTKTSDITKLVADKTTEIQNFTTTKKQEVVDFVNLKDEEMTNKKDHFVNLINQKEVQLAELDSRVRRYWQKWNAKYNGQNQFDIFIDGQNLNLPQEAILNIEVENIDLTIQGVSLTPYTDFDIVNDGTYRKIILKGSLPNTITTGTEVFIKYYKNVGKLYFSHNASHSEGGYDQLTITEGMLDDGIKNKLNGIVASKTVPQNKYKGLTWYNIL